MSLSNSSSENEKNPANKTRDARQISGSEPAPILLAPIGDRSGSSDDDDDEDDNDDNDDGGDNDDDDDDYLSKCRQSSRSVA